VGKRSNMLVAVGLVVFLLGGAIVMLALRNDNGSSGTAVAAADTADSRTVLVATDDLAAGASGSDLVSGGKVRTETASTASAPDAVTSPADLAGKVLALPVKKGEVIRLGSLRAETIKIPDGKQAVAVQVDFIPGVAGQVGPGDLVNIYAVVTKSSDPRQQVPFTKLLLANVEVLKVTDAPPAAAPTTPTTVNPLAAPVASSGTPQVFLVAVDQPQAEKLIFSASNQKLYASLVPKGQQPVPTAGADDANLFG
jgi:Flp pilus assembly protein CpaB